MLVGDATGVDVRKKEGEDERQNIGHLSFLQFVKSGSLPRRLSGQACLIKVLQG